jgi:hypothetical protein
VWVVAAVVVEGAKRVVVVAGAKLVGPGTSSIPSPWELFFETPFDPKSTSGRIILFISTLDFVTFSQALGVEVGHFR